MSRFDNESVINKLGRVRPTLLSRLHNHPSGVGIPNDLKNAVATYLLLNPDDQEVRQARDRLLDSSNQSKQA